MPGYQKITNDGLTRSGTGRMLYSCTHMATVGIKRLTSAPRGGVGEGRVRRVGGLRSHLAIAAPLARSIYKLALGSAADAEKFVLSRGGRGERLVRDSASP